MYTLREKYLRSNGPNECLDIQLSGTTLLTRGVSTLKATSRLEQGTTFSQGGGLDVHKVALQGAVLRIRASRRTIG